jgi:hypothetical protein
MAARLLNDRVIVPSVAWRRGITGIRVSGLCVPDEPLEYVDRFDQESRLKP